MLDFAFLDVNHLQLLIEEILQGLLTLLKLLAFALFELEERLPACLLYHFTTLLGVLADGNFELFELFFQVFHFYNEHSLVFPWISDKGLRDSMILGILIGGRQVCFLDPLLHFL